MIRRARAFSLIELLVTIAIIATLAGMILVGANAISGGAKKSKTNSILGALRSALEVTFAERGVFASPGEHPLAGSAPTRPAFIRLVGGTAVATTGVALTGITLAQVPAGAQQTRVLLTDDLLSDPRAPQLFGMPRYRLGVLGVPQATVTAYRKLPVATTAAQDPDDLLRFPDRQYLIAPSGVPADNAAHLMQLLGTIATPELTALGALHEPPSACATPLFGAQVLSSVAAGGAGSSRWKPDHVLDGTIPSGPEAGQPNWKPYRLPGLACYDAWGTEILYSVREGNRMAVLSAGRDRCFRWDPGKNGILATTADATSPVTDDADGGTDNLIQAVGE
ncbi:MAG: prepilin-type N-terminal cleavage/methylation domain-containing protein [Planctomycetes bacterium]|nr:prepilin-type N-terminal cleavage/methylation domain-containing protein [Planctomycetota bacterium]